MERQLMFVDACAIIALLSEEREARRISKALHGAHGSFTSPVAVLEAVVGLARPDKFNIPVQSVEVLVMEFLDERGIELRDLPPAHDTTALALFAADQFRKGRHPLNLGDCLHYACAKYHDVPILAKDDEFRNTDIMVVP
jgi:ribonuclease VapC